VSFTLPWRRADIPACNGHGNARAVVQAHAALACGVGLNGVQLFSEATRNAVFEQQSLGTDLVLGMPIRFGMGFALTSQFMPLGPNPRACFWGGWGGSIVILDFDARVTFSYVPNRMSQSTTGDLRGFSIAQAVSAATRATPATTK
jgi:hypothetical protein